MPAKKKPQGKAAPKLRSGFEKKVKDSLEKRGVSYEYESTNVPYVVPESKHRYVPDFKLPNGVFVEAKGKFDAAARKKMSLVIEQNPDVDVRMLFMRDNKLTKSSKTKYSDWCEKRGIAYHVSAAGEIPAEWLEIKKKENANEDCGRNKHGRRGVRGNPDVPKPRKR
jgi:predicted GNAT family acetyltransferase